MPILGMPFLTPTNSVKAHWQHWHSQWPGLICSSSTTGLVIEQSSF